MLKSFKETHPKSYQRLVKLYFFKAPIIFLFFLACQDCKGPVLPGGWSGVPGLQVKEELHSRARHHRGQAQLTLPAHRVHRAGQERVRGGHL